jgi:hypothetical protein
LKNEVMRSLQRGYCLGGWGAKSVKLYEGIADKHGLPAGKFGRRPIDGHFKLERYPDEIFEWPCQQAAIATAAIRRLQYAKQGLAQTPKPSDFRWQRCNPKYGDYVYGYFEHDSLHCIQDPITAWYQSTPQFQKAQELIDMIKRGEPILMHDHQD